MSKHSLTFYIFPLTISFVSIILCQLVNLNILSSIGLSLLLKQAAIYGILAIGQSIIMLCGSVDISIGAIVFLSGNVCAMLMSNLELPIPLCIVITVLLAILCGFIDGIMHSYLSFNPLAISLAMIMFYGGCSSMINQYVFTSRMPNSFFSILSHMHLYIFSLTSICWVLLLLLVFLFMNHTYFGYYFYALSSNEKAMRLIGIKVNKYKIISHMLCGLFAGISGIFMLARITNPSSDNSILLSFYSLAIVAFGGITYYGLKYFFAGEIIGTITLSSICIFCIAYGIPTSIQMLIISILFLIALSLTSRKNINNVN